MKNRWALLLALTPIIVIFSVMPTFANEPVGNLVHVELTHGNWYFTSNDIVDNIPLEWSHQWFTNIVNSPDGGSPILNPKVQLETNLNLVRFNPDNPSVFTASPPFYIWNFNGLEIKEPEHLPLSALEPEGTLLTNPRFSASRSVKPETLTEPVTFQTVDVSFKLEESLPPEVNSLGINIGSPIIAYGSDRLVEGYFVSQIPVEGWHAGTDGVQAWWGTDDPSKIEIGKIYTFQATLKSIKSPALLGSPLFKPGVMVSYARWRNDPLVTANSVVINDPNNIISATFSADNIVDWTPSFSDFRFDFWFNPKVSQITPPPPPFYVLAPANVQIEPDTLNLKSYGEWITAYIEFLEVYDVNNIVVSTILLKTPSGIVPVDPNSPATVGDYDSDGVSDLMVKFDRSKVVDKLGSTYVVDDGKGIDQQFELKVVGQLVDETQFEGTDTVRVIKKGK